MQVLTPGTVDVPPPDELARLFTTTDSTTPAGRVIKPKDRAGKALATSSNTNADGTPSASQWADFLHNMKIWKATHPAETDPTNDWWGKAGRQARQRLRDWMRAQAARAAKGLPTKADTPKDEGGKSSKESDPRPPTPQDTAPFGTPAKDSPNAPSPADPRPYPARHPPYTILESATQAAEWLAQRWPKDVEEQGYEAFIDARKRDVLEMIWTTRYWEPLERLDPAACVSRAYCIVDPDWERPPFNDPEHKRGVATYAKPSAPYPLPAPYTGGDQPSPGYYGNMPADFLTDHYSACWIENFTLPTRWNVEDMPPTFFEAHSNHYVSADAPPSKVQFGTYSLPHIYQTAATSAGEMITLPLYGRRYNWTRKIPPGGTTAYSGHMRRHFVQDCRVMALLNPGSGNACDRLTMQLAPCAAMARYFGKAAVISTEFTIEEPAAYVAKANSEDPENIATIVTIEASIAWSYTNLHPSTGLVRCDLYRQSWSRLISPEAGYLPFGAVALKATSNGAIWKAPQTPGHAGETSIIKQGPQLISSAESPLYATQYAFNMRDYANVAGANGTATAWQLLDGHWKTAPGILSIGDICDR